MTKGESSYQSVNESLYQSDGESSCSLGEPGSSSVIMTETVGKRIRGNR